MIVTVILLIAAIAVMCLLWWWFVGRNAPRYPPLEIDENDPAMLAAIAQARRSLTRFRSLSSSAAKETQVKIPFKTNTGEIEHLWAQVLGMTETSLSVQYLTPPVSHTGTLERVHEHPITDIEDWVVINAEGEIHGGYTQRVMFEKARAQWGRLPPELEKQAARYIEP